MGAHAIFALTCVLAVGCTPAALVQNDDLRAKIPWACRTLEGCLLLRDEAQRRVDECTPDGHCSDARDDAAAVARRIVRFQAERSENQAKADRQADERRERLEQEEEQERQRREWLQSLQSEYARALDDCTSQALASTSPPTFDCRFVVADSALEARRVECAASCKDETEKLDALRPSPPSQPTPVSGASASPTVAPASRPAPSSRSETGGGGGTALLCCDGSLSPTCACPGHRGCCSHHGGVCGCR
jgi:hypothetical protein